MVCEQACSCGIEMDKGLVTNVWSVWSLTFITRVIAGSVVVWEIHFHFGSRHFLFERALCFFLRHDLSWFCLVQVSTTQFCSFKSFLMARVSNGTEVSVSPALASSSNLGSPIGSIPDREGTGYRARTMEDKINEIYLQLPLFMQNASRILNCVQTLSQTGRPDD